MSRKQLKQLKMEYHECLNCGMRMERDFVSWDVPECPKCGDHLDVVDITNKVWEEARND